MAAGSSSAPEPAAGLQDGPPAPAVSTTSVENGGGVEEGKKDGKKKRSIRLRRNRQSREGGSTGVCVILTTASTSARFHSRGQSSAAFHTCSLLRTNVLKISLIQITDRMIQHFPPSSGSDRTGVCLPVNEPQNSRIDPCSG